MHLFWRKWSLRKLVVLFVLVLWRKYKTMKNIKMIIQRKKIRMRLKIMIKERKMRQKRMKRIKIKMIMMTMMMIWAHRLRHIWLNLLVKINHKSIHCWIKLRKFKNYSVIDVYSDINIVILQICFSVWMIYLLLTSWRFYLFIFAGCYVIIFALISYNALFHEIQIL